MGPTGFRFPDWATMLAVLRWLDRSMRETTHLTGRDPPRHGGFPPRSILPNDGVYVDWEADEAGGSLTGSVPVDVRPRHGVVVEGPWGSPDTLRGRPGWVRALRETRIAQALDEVTRRPVIVGPRFLTWLSLGDVTASTWWPYYTEFAELGSVALTATDPSSESPQWGPR